MDPFRARQVPESVEAEFKKRTDGTKLMKWTAQRYPWIYVLSCAGGGCDNRYNELGNDPDVGGKTLSLFGGNPSLSAYNKSTKLPHPTLTGLSVKAMGSLGTTRKATIKLSCYTDEDLLELQKCFFIPGMDVRVQWGWSEDCSGNKPPPVIRSPSMKPGEAVCQINQLRKKHANYDGFQGIVANFKYSLTKSNFWDCEIEVISMADPFTDSKVSNSKCQCPREVETDEGETVKDFGPVYAALADMYESPTHVYRVFADIKAKSKKTRGRSGTKGKYHHWSVLQYEGVDRTETGGEKDGHWFDGTFGGEETTETWISFGAFIDLLNVMSIPNDEDGTFPLGRIDCNEILLPKPLYLVSADPRVCILGGGDLDVEEDLDFNRESGRRLPDCVEDRESGRKVRLARIMCNVVFLLKEYKSVYDGDGKLKTLVDNVLRGINRVSGSPWSFVSISSQEACDDKDGPVIQILDERQAMKSQEPFLIPSSVGDSSLRSFSLDLKMTGAMKTQALYSGNSQKSRTSLVGGDGGCEAVGADAFILANESVNKAKPKPSTLKTSCGKCEDSSNAADEPTEEDLYYEMSYEVNDQTVGALQTWVDKKVGNVDMKKCAGTPLPFDFNFEIDGIGGFEFGQMISANRIPKSIRREFRWQITKVEHNITVNDWTTSVSTVCRSNPFGSSKKPGTSK